MGLGLKKDCIVNIRDLCRGYEAYVLRVLRRLHSEKKICLGKNIGG